MNALDTINGILALAALIAALLHAMNAKFPLWVSPFLLAVIHLLSYLPLGR